jgi:hypothetical protein
MGTHNIQEVPLHSIRRRIQHGWLVGLMACTLSGAAVAGHPDPFAANNSLYPAPGDWAHGFRPSNYDYPAQPADPLWLRDKDRPRGALTVATAPAYVQALKRFIARDIARLVNEPVSWSPLGTGWYDMPWGGQGSPLPSGGGIDAGSGREALLGSYTGQILQPQSYPSDPPTVPFQNHAVVYYNDVAAHQLGRIWKNPFRPDLGAAQFPAGSMVVKVEAATLTDKQWPVLKNSTVSWVYRPPVQTMAGASDAARSGAVLTEMRFLQMAVRVKDPEAAPDTGWVFVAFAYDTRATGATVWDRTLPVGAMWGNDAQLSRYPDGLGPNGRLTQTWVAEGLPPFVRDGLGWGGRLAGPLDLGLRHNVVTVSGKRYGNAQPGRPPALAASSCVSCHGTAQYPFMANLYPSPNMPFPPEGGQFLLFDPGSPEWAQWFQSRPGNVAISGRNRSGIVATDYDMMLTFALAQATGSAETAAFVRQRLAGH